MPIKTLTLAATTIAALVSSTAMAGALTAAASTDLNLRAGPGPDFRIVEVIDAEASVTVAGCLESGEWCSVDTGTAQGWAYAPYLTFAAEDGLKPLTEAPTQTITVIEDTTPRDEATLIGAGMGAVAGAIVAGPVGAVIGTMVSGIAAHNAVDPEVSVYVQQNPVEPVFLSGEPVVGAALPETVTYYEVPNHENLAYLNVNGDLVVVHRADRRIVQIVR